jgi:hypothetical protein
VRGGVEWRECKGNDEYDDDVYVLEFPLGRERRGVCVCESVVCLYLIFAYTHTHTRALYEYDE